MVRNLQHFVDACLASNKTPKNTWLGNRLKPIHCEQFNAENKSRNCTDTILLAKAKMEDVTAEMLEGNEQCDTVVSECLGVVSLSRLKR